MTAPCCDYCDQPATVYDKDSDEPLCQACARDHHATEWRVFVSKIGPNWLRREAARS